MENTKILGSISMNPQNTNTLKNGGKYLDPNQRAFIKKINWTLVKSHVITYNIEGH